MSNPYRESLNKETIANVSEALRMLSAAVNVMGQEEVVAAALAEALTKEHRTLQQGIVRAMTAALSQYSTSSTDMRNFAAVELCKKLKPVIDDHHLPYI